MMCWNISVYRQDNDGASPATSESQHSSRIAIWQTKFYSDINWLKDLAKEGKAIDLGGDGYPNRFTATAEHIVPRIIPEPPGARAVWGLDEGDCVTEEWEGRTVVDAALARQCRFDEWLLIVVWDES